MITCLKPLSVAVAAIALLSISVMPSNAAPPDGVTFITEIAGYAGENPYSEDAEWYPSLDVDNDGDLWVCSNGHVFEYHDGEWIDHTDASGGGDYVAITAEGVVWVASSEHLASYDGEVWTDHSEGIPDKIYAISAEGNNVWMTCGNVIGNRYLVHFDGETVTNITEGILQDWIYRLTATPDGVWLVHHNLFNEFDCVGDNCPRGTSFFDGTIFHYHSVDNGMPRNKVNNDTNVPWVVYSTSRNRIYAICNNNLVEFKNDQWLVLNNNTSSIPFVEGYEGTLWQGSMANIMWGCSLSYMENNTWMEFDVTEIQEWINNEIYHDYGYQVTSSLAVTGNGLVWVGTTDGIFRIDTKILSLKTTGIEAEFPIAVASKIVCFPNPFNNSTMIHFNLLETSKYDAHIYSLSGQQIRHLSTGWLPAGSHALQWDCRNDVGNIVSSGMYIVQINTNMEPASLVGKMLFIK